MCPLVHQLLTRKDPARVLANRFTKSPDQFVPNTLSDDPLSSIQIDETGPLRITNASGTTKIYVLIVIEVVTHQVYLIAMKEQTTVSFIQSLEVLQQLRGKLGKIIVDLHSSHLNLEMDEKVKEGGVLCVSPTLMDILQKGNHNLLASQSVSVLLAEGKNH